MKRWLLAQPDTLARREVLELASAIAKPETCHTPRSAAGSLCACCERWLCAHADPTVPPSRIL